uniref:Uncharacterized protein n=1 Tax=Candidatus Kentrum sp. LFY TaxID=2126342 RepID=A0A450WSF8_9GAMM|nr:MAG: hypothetical protein BECKLFY1418C_GA0070996_10655 [Candidatus Kentron sp. LFY]
MAYNKTYHEAEQKIRAALRLGETTLDLGAKWGARDEERLGELPQSLARLTELRERPGTGRGFLVWNPRTAAASIPRNGPA